MSNIKCIIAYFIFVFLINYPLFRANNSFCNSSKWLINRESDFSDSLFNYAISANSAKASTAVKKVYPPT